MTEQRLKEIFIEAVFPTVGVTDETLLWFETVSSRQDYIEAMKQAVNEALEEAADKAEVQIKPRHKPTVLRDKTIPTEDWAASVYKESILKLKVK